MSAEVVYKGVDGSTYHSVDDIPNNMPILTDFPGYYVTKEGKGYSSHRGCRRDRRMTLYGVVLGPMAIEKANSNRWSFAFWDKGKRTRQSVHVLVLETFVGPRPEGHYARHIDGDFANNRLDNLTYSLYEPNGRQTLTEAEVLEIANSHREISHRELSQNYNVGENVICAIRRGRRWGHLLKKHGIKFHKTSDFRKRDGFVLESVDGKIYESPEDIPDNMPILTDYTAVYVDKRGNLYSARSGQSKRRVTLYGRSLIPRRLNLHKSGYFHAQTYEKGVGHINLWMHKVVAETFLGPCPDGLEIRHLDGNSKNNHLSNLKYGTKSENRIDSLDHQTHWTQKLNERQVLEILAAPFEVTNTSLAKKYGVGITNISKIRRGEIWRHLQARHGIVVVPMDGKKRNGSSRTIPDEQRAEICASQEHATVLAEKYGLHRGTIDRIRRDGKVKC